MPHRTKQLEERIKEDIADMLSHRSIGIKHGDREIRMFVSGKESTYKLDEIHYMGFHNRDNQCFYSKKHDITIFCIQHYGVRYRIIGGFQGDCDLSKFV